MNQNIWSDNRVKCLISMSITFYLHPQRPESTQEVILLEHGSALKDQRIRVSSSFDLVRYNNNMDKSREVIYIITFLSSFIYFFVSLYKGDTSWRVTANIYRLLWTWILIEYTSDINLKLIFNWNAILRCLYFETATGI